MTRDTILRLPQPFRFCAQLVWPTGQHRPPGSIVDQLFVDCRVCGVTSGTVYGGVVIHCSNGHFIRRADQ